MWCNTVFLNVQPETGDLTALNKLLQGWGRLLQKESQKAEQVRRKILQQRKKAQAEQRRQQRAAEKRREDEERQRRDAIRKRMKQDLTMNNLPWI